MSFPLIRFMSMVFSFSFDKQFEFGIWRHKSNSLPNQKKIWPGCIAIRFAWFRFIIYRNICAKALHK